MVLIILFFALKKYKLQNHCMHFQYIGKDKWHSLSYPIKDTQFHFSWHWLTQHYNFLNRRIPSGCYLDSLDFILGTLWITYVIFNSIVSYFGTQWLRDFPLVSFTNFLSCYLSYIMKVSENTSIFYTAQNSYVINVKYCIVANWNTDLNPNGIEVPNVPITIRNMYRDMHTYTYIFN